MTLRETLFGPDEYWQSKFSAIWSTPQSIQVIASPIRLKTVWATAFARFSVGLSIWTWSRTRTVIWAGFEEPLPAMPGGGNGVERRKVITVFPRLLITVLTSLLRLLKGDPCVPQTSQDEKGVQKPALHRNQFLEGLFV